MAGYLELGPRLACPGQLALPEDHRAISEKQDEVAWNANRHSDRELEEMVIEVLRLRVRFKNVRPDVVLG